MLHKLTIDLEEWFHSYLFEVSIPRSLWNKSISRIEIQFEILIGILNRTNTKATFFVVGWLADQFPNLIEKIIENGHQIGCHSYWHKPLYTLSENEFIEDMQLCVNAFTKSIGKLPSLYRAPNFSINSQNSNFVKILYDFGITVDSSCHKPSFHPDYGAQNAFPTAEFEKYNIAEIPIPTLNIAGLDFPFSGGAYFRYYPYAITKNILKSFEKKNTRVVFYIHPWELDDNLPKSNLTYSQDLRLRYNIKNNASKFELLLTDFKFEPLVDLHDSIK